VLVVEGIWTFGPEKKIPLNIAANYSLDIRHSLKKFAINKSHQSGLQFGVLLMAKWRKKMAK
jgi:hypothetical protein